MARNTIQKRFTTTIVHGYIIENGEPCATQFEIEKRIGINAAQTFIRREYPSFAATSIETKDQLYKMTFDDFKRLATPCDDEEAE